MKKVLLFFAFFSIITLNAFAGPKTDYRNALIFAYSQVNSEFEDDNIKLLIYNEQLWAINKTSKTIFIDYSQCFAFHNGQSTPLFDPEQKRLGGKKASKQGATSEETFLTLAPSMGTKQNPTLICPLSVFSYGEYTTSETPSGDFTEYDKRLLNILESLLAESKNADPKGKEYKGTASRHLTEDESINVIGASVAYAFNKKSEDWTNVSLTTWVSDVIFAPYYVEMPKDLTKKEQRGFGVKETQPAVVHVRAKTPFEFDEDRSPIIVFDWEGDYKKGTFELNNPIVEKKKRPSFGKILFSTWSELSDIEEKIEYKKITRFDGPDTDWGKMSYASEILKTGQSK